MSRSKKDIQPHWRPNFVNVSALPDIKVIRTNFIINSISVLLMLLVGFYVLQREYRAHSLSKTIATIEQQIRVAEGEDATSLKFSREFRDAAKHVAELEKFYATPFMAHDFLTQIIQMRPEQLIFKQLSLVESLQTVDGAQVVVYRINISGEVRSLTVLDEFKGQLSKWELLEFEGYGLEIDEALQGRDADTGIFPYTLEITLKPQKETPAADTEGRYRSRHVHREIGKAEISGEVGARVSDRGHLGCFIDCLWFFNLSSRRCRL